MTQFVALLLTLSRALNQPPDIRNNCDFRNSSMVIGKPIHQLLNGSWTRTTHPTFHCDPTVSDSFSAFSTRPLGWSSWELRPYSWQKAWGRIPFKSVYSTHSYFSCSPYRFWQPPPCPGLATKHRSSSPGRCGAYFSLFRYLSSTPTPREKIRFWSIF